MLGESLKEQIRAYFPNLPELFEKRFHADEAARYQPAAPEAVAAPAPEAASIVLHSAPPRDAHSLIAQAQTYNGMLSFAPEGPYSYIDLIRAERPRELELLHVQYEIRRLSLAAVTHLVRHRIQSVLVPQAAQAALFMPTYVLPKSVQSSEEACKIYQDAFAANTAVLNRMLQAGLPAEAAQYFALAGNQVDVLCDMNGRELLHFMKLRTCNRAQWEIRACAVELLRQLRAECPAVFECFGPSCFVTGKCPEGRLSCGKMQEMQALFAGELP